MAAEEKKIPPPYASYIGFHRVLEKLREDGHELPDQIDRTVLNTLSGSAQSSMLKALEALRLIDSAGKPTKALRDLVAQQRGTDGFRAVLRPIVEKAYAFLFNASINLKTATTNQVQNAFRAQEISGSTVSKCIAFFLAAAKDAGIEVSKYVRTPPMADVTIKKRGSVRNSNAEAKEDSEDIDIDQQQVELFPFTSDLHPALQGVLKTLPAPGEPLNEKERRRFMTAFEAVLALAHPAEDGGE
jgi:hypothetical protein